jgi:sugar O-acyltransferase (sialic acid O-acetyltransferase NeuD family)
VEVVVYGVGSTYVHEVHESLLRLGWSVRAWVTNVEGGNEPRGLEPVVAAADMSPEWRALGFVFAMVTPAYRQQIEDEVRSLGVTEFPAVVDPTTVVASTAVIDEGASVNGAGMIGANTTLGRFSLVNRSASVSHDVIVAPYASLGPGCVLAAEVQVGAGAFIGTGAVLGPEVTIGVNAVVGAGAVVVKAVPDNTVVVGNPARVLRDGPGYNGVGIRWT